MAPPEPVAVLPATRLPLPSLTTQSRTETPPRAWHAPSTHSAPLPHSAWLVHPVQIPLTQVGAGLWQGGLQPHGPQAPRLPQVLRFLTAPQRPAQTVTRLFGRHPLPRLRWDLRRLCRCLRRRRHSFAKRHNVVTSAGPGRYLPARAGARGQERSGRSPRAPVAASTRPGARLPRLSAPTESRSGHGCAVRVTRGQNPPRGHHSGHVAAASAGHAKDARVTLNRQ